MDSPRSKTPLVLTLLGLGILQQLVSLGIALCMEHLAHAPGVLVRADALGKNLVFIVLVGAINGAFYNAAWLNLLDATRVRARLPWIFLVGLSAAAVFFFAGHLASAVIDRTRSYASWAQVAALVVTLASGFRVSDAHPKPKDHPPEPQR